MPLSHVPVPLIGPTSVPDPANVHQLGALIAPAHFLLSLVLLRPVYDSWFPWLAAALATTLLATRPVLLGTRSVERASLMRVTASMYGLGYLNTLLSAACFMGSSALREPGGWPTALVVALPVALLFTLPFMVLDLPVIGFAQGLDGPARFDSRDALRRLVGSHALAVSGLLLFILLMFGPVFSGWLTVLVGSVVLGVGGLGLMVSSSLRIQRRDDFVARVLRGEVPGYDVDSLGDAPPPPALSREVDQRLFDEPNALYSLEPGPANGAYRTGPQRIPVARV